MNQVKAKVSSKLVPTAPASAKEKELARRLAKEKEMARRMAKSEGTLASLSKRVDRGEGRTLELERLSVQGYVL